MALCGLMACSENSNTVTRSADFSGRSGIEAVPPAQESTMEVYLTGYSYWDNTPPGSAAIAHPVIRSRAGGTGTYADPITIAVGHVKNGRNSTPDYRPGTKFYIQNLRKYAIVEDVCGDGPKPQYGPCHVGYQGRPWLDIWVGGKHVDRNFVQSCMYRLTGLQSVIKNPRPGYPV